MSIYSAYKLYVFYEVLAKKRSNLDFMLQPMTQRIRTWRYAQTFLRLSENNSWKNTK